MKLYRVVAFAALVTCSLEALALCQDNDGVRRAYFGDLHVHTRLSMDAYVFENEVDPLDAYDAARGLEIDIAPTETGMPPRRYPLGDGPLDFAAVTDHAEYLGEVNLCTARVGDSPVFVSDQVGTQLIATGFRDAGEQLISVCREFRTSNNVQVLLALASLCPDRLDADNQLCAVLPAFRQSAWATTLDAAQSAYEPCEFTTFAAYEYSGAEGEDGSEGSNHRNVLYRDIESITDANAQPRFVPIDAIDAPTPSLLGRRVRAQCLGDPDDPDANGLPGCDVLAIPHTSNFSRGAMFQLGANESAADRREFEPVIEIVQYQYSSECAPYSHPDDPGCAFEPYPPKADETEALVSPGFVRGGLNEGMRLAFEGGVVNPFVY
ncbi:MAG: DUF3604 domain-containing protein, partial [Pseudomonadota bacterium]